MDFPLQDRHRSTGASATSASHHRAGQEAGAQNMQGEAERAALAQPGEEEF